MSAPHLFNREPEASAGTRPGLAPRSRVNEALTRPPAPPGPVPRPPPAPPPTPGAHLRRPQPVLALRRQAAPTEARVELRGPLVGERLPQPRVVQDTLDAPDAAIFAGVNQHGVLFVFDQVRRRRVRGDHGPPGSPRGLD